MSNAKKISSLGKRFIVLLILFAGVNQMLSFWYYKTNERRNPIYLRDAKFEAHKAPIKYLFLGHSRVLGGVNDSLIPGSFTFATNSEPNIFTYYKLRHILEDTDKEVETILMPIGIGTFFSLKDPNVYDCAYWKRYVDFYELGSEMGQRSLYVTAYVRATAFPYARQITQMVNKRFWNKNKKRKKLEDFDTEEAKLDFARTSIIYNSTVRTPYDSVCFKYFRRSIELCKSKNVNVIFVKYPVSRLLPRCIQQLDRHPQRRSFAPGRRANRLPRNRDYRSLHTV